MKRTTSTFLLALTAVLAQAQATSRLFPAQEDDRYVDERVFFGGLNAGVNFTQVDGDTKSGYHKVGINAGAVVYARFRPAFGASLELRFAQKGSVSKAFTSNAGGVAALEVYKIRLNYAEVPLMLHYFAPGRFTYSLGVAYAYLVSANETYEAGYPVNLHDLYPFQKYELSGLAGGNYVLAKHWSVEARYQYSITSIRTPDHIPQGLNTGSGRQSNNVVTFRLMYLF